ncbi:MAG TPA: Nif11-like leader peptide family natural product precursor [Trichocoleus sp.]
MATEAINRLLRAAQDNPALRDKLNSAPNVEAFVKVAQGYGYRFTIDEWREVGRSSGRGAGSSRSRRIEL